MVQIVMGLERCAHAHLKLRCARFVCVSCGRWTVTIRLLLAEPPVVSSQSPCIATVVGRLCCTRLLIHYNANLCSPYTIILHRSEVGSVSQSLFIFAFTSRDSPVAGKPHFPAHWLRCYVCLLVFCAIVVCLSLVYNTEVWVVQSFWFCLPRFAVQPFTVH